MAKVLTEVFGIWYLIGEYYGVARPLHTVK